MCRKKFYARNCLGLAALLFAASLGCAEAVTPTVVLPESTKPVDAAPVAGAATPARPYVTRSTLTAAETITSMTFEVALKMRDFPDLQARISRGERIPAKEMAEKYEPSASDYEKVVDWLKGEGFTIVRQDSHHMAVFVGGKVSLVASSLKVDFARVKSDGKEYTSAVTAPSVPSDISPLLTGINGLQPHLHARKHLIKPQGTNASTGSAQYLPSQIATAYGSASLLASNLAGGGQTIAIVIDTFPSTADLLLFWKNCNVPQSLSNIQFVLAVPLAAGATLVSPSGEETLDVEWSSAMAPQAHIRVYAATDLGNADLDMAYQQVYDDVTAHPELGIHQMSMSFGEGETYTTQTQVNTDDQYFAELSAAGVTCFASSGDGGATPGPNGGGDKSGPVQVESPASDPNVVGVGGTSLTLDSNNYTSTETVWNNSSGASGGGNSIYFTRPVYANWQTGTGVPTGSARFVPDICGPADPNFGAIVYFQGAQTVFGGTSWASPMLAAFCALINQARANAGLASETTFGPSLYPLLSPPATYSTNIHDITSGTNTTRGSNGFSAGLGYDRSTGVGSPKMAQLAPTLVGGAVVGVEMPAAMASVEPGQSATFTVAVGGSAATYQWQREPTGSTTWSNLSDNGAYSGATTAALTITTATAVMSGDRFRCVITLASNVTTISTPSALVVDLPLVISTLAGSVGTSALTNGTGSGASFAIPSGIAIDASGNLFIADYSNNAIREVTPAGVVTTPYGSAAGTKGANNGTGNAALFTSPNGIAFDGSHGQSNLYVADTGNNLIRKISGGYVSTFTTGGNYNLPEGVAVDSSGNVYVADTGNDTIRKITPQGTITTLAGQTGVAGYSDGAAASALFNAPSALAVDASGNVYVADFGNSVVRKISGGTVSTIGGQAHVAGYLDGPASTALFNTPSGVTVDTAGNVYVADCLVPPLNTNATGNDLVRKISPTGVVSTLAGQAGNNGSADGTGTAASFYSVQAVALNNATGTFYFADTYNDTIREGMPPPVMLSITATQPLAQVFGAVPGVFTVTRVGGDPSASVTASYAIGGTAVEGTDYTPALPGTLTIPVGETSATISITPVENDAATANPTLQLSLDSSAAYMIGSSPSATVTIQEITPFQTWSSTQFGADATTPSVGGEGADPNNNGVPNLLEYAFGSNPTQTGTEPLPVVTTALGSDNQEHLEITFNQLTGASGLTYTVQVSSDLVTWSSGPSATTVVSQSPNGSGLMQVTVMDNTAASSTGRRFIRVQVGEAQ
jgi:kumamolisin